MHEVLRQANYTDAGVAEVLGIQNYLSIRDVDIPRLLRHLTQGTPLETLIRVFLFGVPTDRTAFERAVQPIPLQTWFEVGLLMQVDAATVAAPLSLVPFHDILISFDWARLRSNHVMGIASSSVTLATLTIRRPSHATLDLGTGSGIHALLAARHSDRVVAVDRNPRAVNMTAFNAQLNRFSHVDSRLGDLFAPVQGETFDLIVSNPPFVISPESRYMFRDGGMSSDDFCKRIVQHVPPYLNDGGFCQILCNWVHLAGQDWQERLASWFIHSGCDVWVMRSETRDAATYASTWIQDSETETPAAFARHFDTWMAYYDQQRIEAISLGLITMRRRVGGPANWFQADNAPQKMLGTCGDAVLRRFDLHDFLQTVEDDQALLASRLRVANEARWEQQYEPSSQGWYMGAGQLTLAKGLAYTNTIDPVGVRLVIYCDGQRTLREVLVEVATSFQTDVAHIAPACLAAVRRLTAEGFLLPVDD
jgi:SAM-dependent methyltransferase